MDLEEYRDNSKEELEFLRGVRDQLQEQITEADQKMDHPVSGQSGLEWLRHLDQLHKDKTQELYKIDREIKQLEFNLMLVDELSYIKALVRARSG